MRHTCEGTSADFEIYVEGRSLSRKEVETLEAELDSNPNAVEARIRLIAFYSEAEPNVEKWCIQIEWMIVNKPHFWITGNCDKPNDLELSKVQSLSRMWCESAYQTNAAAAFGHGGEFLSFIDPETAEHLITQAVRVEPDNIEWQRSLTNLVMRRADRTRAASDIEAAFELAKAMLKIENHPGERAGLLTRFGNFALSLPKFSQAQWFAQQLLELCNEREISHRQRTAHELLGLAALGLGQVQEAENQLLQAGQCEFMHGTRLAQALLDLGKTETVLQFFQLSLARETSSDEALLMRRWIQEIREGERPLMKFE